MGQYKRLNKCNILFLVISYRILLDVIYVITVNYYYAYYGFLNNSSIQSFFFSYLHMVYFLPFISMSFKRKEFAEYVILFLGLLFFIPGTSMMAFVPMKTGMLFAWDVFWICLFLANAGMGHIGVINKFYITVRNKRIFAIGLGCFFCIVVMYVSYKYTDFRFLITFTNEYVLRAEQREYAMGTILQYLYGMSTTLISTIICLAGTRKKYWLVVTLMIVQIFSFSIGGHKFYLLLSVLAIMTGCMYEIVYKKFGNVAVLCGLISVLLAEIFERSILGTYRLSANISRRVLFVPQHLNYCYYDFFSKNPFDFFRQGILRWLGAESNYKKGIALTIGEAYVGENCNANNGLFSEAYSNLGILGCVILPFSLVIILRLLQRCVRGQDNSVIVFFAATCALIFGSGNISTGLLSNGIIITALFFWLFRNHKKVENIKG